MKVIEIISRVTVTNDLFQNKNTIVLIWSGLLSTTLTKEKLAERKEIQIQDGTNSVTQSRKRSLFKVQGCKFERKSHPFCS